MTDRTFIPPTKHSHMSKALTAERLRELAIYHPDTGIFVRRIGRFGYSAGTVMGCRSGGYVVIRVDDVLYKAHRLAWFYVHGEWPTGVIDHADGDPSNNRIGNLRPATKSENNANSKARASVAGLKGVYLHTKNKRWVAQIKEHGRAVYLGTFDTREEAHAAYAARAGEVYGTFARLK